MLVNLLVLTILMIVSLASPADRFSFGEQCVDRFCPPGTYCEVLARVVKCKSPPCRPIIACLPESVNGCASYQCPSGKVCVEHTIPCIGRNCKKAAKCVVPGTCEAKVCPPSHKCIDKEGPKCVSTIFTEAEVALLSKDQ